MRIQEELLIRELQLLLWCNLLGTVVVLCNMLWKRPSGVYYPKWTILKIDTSLNNYKKFSLLSFRSSVFVIFSINTIIIRSDLRWRDGQHPDSNETLLYWPYIWKKTPVSHWMLSRIFTDDSPILCETRLYCACQVTHWGSVWFCLRVSRTRCLLQPSGCWYRSPRHPRRRIRTTLLMTIYILIVERQRVFNEAIRKY